MTIAGASLEHLQMSTEYSSATRSAFPFAIGNSVAAFFDAWTSAGFRAVRDTFDTRAMRHVDSREWVRAYITDISSLRKAVVATNACLLTDPGKSIDMTIQSY